MADKLHELADKLPKLADKPSDLADKHLNLADKLHEGCQTTKIGPELAGKPS